ncbi:hypothetical protein MW887_007653 [Aspergillus wentii]|nr:hypothetical protein MW887_007653 [Aspergillus wentii]
MIFNIILLLSWVFLLPVNVLTIPAGYNSALGLASVSRITRDLTDSALGINLKQDFIIPYYVDPSDGGWTPLEKLVSSHGNVNFTVIINPENGPGSIPPSEGWLAAVPRLNAFSNILVIGYVRTQEGQRNILEVKADITTYAGWPTIGNPSFAVHGIFLDETPSEFDANKVAYYKDLVSTIRNSTGLGPNHYSVMNPGTMADVAYIDISDVTVIFESPYSEFQTTWSSNLFDKVKELDLAHLSTMVYDIPSNVEISTLVRQLKSISSDNPDTDEYRV